MKMKKILYKDNTEYKALYECENCGKYKKCYWSDDIYFNDKVIPDIRCSSCGMSSKHIQEINL